MEADNDDITDMEDALYGINESDDLFMQLEEMLPPSKFDTKN